MSDFPENLYISHTFLYGYSASERDGDKYDIKYIRADLVAERDAEIERLREEIALREELINDGLNTKDKLVADNATLRAHIERWSYAGSLPPPTGENHE